MLVHGLEIAIAVATYLLILVGGLVHGTGSSLACPDWPTCYGTFLPKMAGGVLVEHSHRLAAGTVVIMTLVLAGMLTLTSTASRDGALRPLRPFGWLVFGSSIVTLRRAWGRPGLRTLAIAAPVLVCVQIALGLHAVTSFLDLATVESHLAVATALLATQILIVLRADLTTKPGRVS